LRFGAITEAVQVGVFVEAEEGDTARDGLCILKAFAAVA